MTAKLHTLTLRATDPEAQRRFYCGVLGMSELGGGRIGYSDQQAAIRFVPAETAYSPLPSDLYWKIALSVPDIELAHEQLTKAGISCSEPHQFRDVGYLAKFADPEGFSIELIDHWFKGERPATVSLDKDQIGGGAHLSLVTLRTADILAVEQHVLDLGMRRLSIQPVTPFGFTLYFYAFTKEVPPNADHRAIENRTWVYQRPYTVLELQHVHGLREETHPAPAAAGYQGLSISSDASIGNLDRLGISGAV